MNRRNFFRSLVGTAIAVSTAARLSLQPETATQKIKVAFDPLEYVGEFRWINLTPTGEAFPFTFNLTDKQLPDSL